MWGIRGNAPGVEGELPGRCTGVGSAGMLTPLEHVIHNRVSPNLTSTFHASMVCIRSDLANGGVTTRPFSVLTSWYVIKRWPRLPR